MARQAMDMQARAARRDEAGCKMRDWRAEAAGLFPDCNLIERRRFVMRDDFVEMVKNGSKRTTIRFDERGLEYPSSNVLPVFTIADDQPHGEAMPATAVALTSVRYLRCRDLSNAHAEADGFHDRAELVRTLLHFYPSITPDSMVCVYAFAPLDHAPSEATAVSVFGKREALSGPAYA